MFTLLSYNTSEYFLKSISQTIKRTLYSFYICLIRYHLLYCIYDKYNFAIEYKINFNVVYFNNMCLLFILYYRTFIIDYCIYYQSRI